MCNMIKRIVPFLTIVFCVAVGVVLFVIFGSRRQFDSNLNDCVKSPNNTDLSESETEDSITETGGNPDLPEVMPELVRPSGYDKRILTKDTALALLSEFRSMRQLIFYSGYTKDYTNKDINVWDWANNPDNQVSQELVSYSIYPNCLIYFVPGLDTMKKFDEYFLQVFTEDSLESIKEEWNIFECNGRLVGNSTRGIGGVSMLWYATTVESITYIDDPVYEDNIATVTYKNYLGGYGPYGDTLCRYQYKDCTYYFSDDYGWRIDLDSLFDVELW